MEQPYVSVNPIIYLNRTNRKTFDQQVPLQYDLYSDDRTAYSIARYHYRWNSFPSFSVKPTNFTIYDTVGTNSTANNMRWVIKATYI